MSLARLELRDDCLHFFPAGAELDLVRPFNAAEFQRLRAFALDYRDALAAPSGVESRLLQVGQQLFAWLDGAQHWGGLLPDPAAGPALLELAVPSLAPELEARRRAFASAFVEAPWELLADDFGHLVGQGRLSPYRRVGASAQPQPPSQRRLSLLFMAAGPEASRASHLFYEEEERAILDAVGHLALDLIVEESGDSAQLGAALRRGSQLLHLSCHGVPVADGERKGKSTALLLEDPVGDPKLVGPTELLRDLGPSAPHLLFLSACTTAQPGTQSLSYAAQMLAGLPAVLGWSGNVADREATRFAALLYGALSRGQELSAALNQARVGLRQDCEARAAAGERVHNHWHLARL